MSASVQHTSPPALAVGADDAAVAVAYAIRDVARFAASAVAIKFGACGAAHLLACVASGFFAIGAAGGGFLTTGVGGCGFAVGCTAHTIAVGRLAIGAADFQALASAAGVVVDVVGAGAADIGAVRGAVFGQWFLVGAAQVGRGVFQIFCAAVAFFVRGGACGAAGFDAVVVQVFGGRCAAGAAGFAAVLGGGDVVFGAAGACVVQRQSVAAGVLAGATHIFA